jgi:hypothetical protein
MILLYSLPHPPECESRCLLQKADPHLTQSLVQFCEHVLHCDFSMRSIVGIDVMVTLGRKIINLLELFLQQKIRNLTLVSRTRCLKTPVQHFCDKSVVNIFNNSLAVYEHGR